MTQDQNENNLTRKTVLFPDGEQAVLVETSSLVTAEEIIDNLGIIEPEVVIPLFGSVDMLETGLQSRILQLFNYGLAQTAAKFNTLIIDENLYGRCMTEFSKALRVHTGNRLKRSSKIEILPVESTNAILLGITNDNEVTWPDRSDIDNDDGRRMLESSHTHFVVVKGTHPDRKIDTIDTIAERFSQKMPVLVVLVNDSPLAKDGILRSVRRGWPILIIEGSGGLADEIHHIWQKKQDYLKELAEWNPNRTDASKPIPPFIMDSAIAEVIAKGDLQFFSITDTPEKLERRINSRLRSQSVLELAYQLLRTYSLNANQYQSVSGRIQNAILMLGVLITSTARLK